MKKVLVFTCNIGGGHILAAEAVKEILQEEYEIQTVNFVKEIVKGIDFVKLVSFGYKNLEDGFNFCAKHRWNRLANFISYCTMKFLRIKGIENKLKKNLLIYFKKNQPDLVISVIGFVNYSIALAADQLKIPFLIIPTDLDQSYAASGFKNMRTFQIRKKLPNLKYAAALDNFEMNKTLPLFSLSKEQISFIGYPLRRKFFEKKNIPALKEEWKIPKNKLVVMILMGKLGASSIYDFVKAISKIKKPIHLMACIGTHYCLKKKLSKIEQNELFSFSVVEYTPLISDIMALSDAIIMKPGSMSFVEACSMNKPVLIDCIYCKTPLRIEQFNCNFCVDNNLGEVITKIEDLEKLLLKVTAQNETAQTLFTENFAKNLKSLIISFFQ